MIAYLKTVKNTIIIAIIIAVVSFAFGRYSATETKTTESDKTSIATKQDTDTHVQSITTTVKEPDGTEKTVTTTTSDTVSKDTTKEIETSQKETEVLAKGSKINLNILGGYDVIHTQPVYGVAVSKELLGPISVGAWALSNTTVGVSIGVSF